jgi:glutathione synthase/RimK-type ligase-like ATP-grasp enzyme
MIGVIFHTRKLHRIVSGIEQRENVDYYFQIAKEHEVDLFFYSPETLLPYSLEVEGYLYSYKEEELKKRKTSIPKVNLIRTIISKESELMKVKQIEEGQNVEFINRVPRRNKYNINYYLNNIPELKGFIPHTEKLSFKTLVRNLDLSQKVIIKPFNGAHGERIVYIEKGEKLVKLRTFLHGKKIEKVFPIRKLFNQYKKLKKPYLYLIQTYLSSYEYMGEKIDIRTSVQKDYQGVWKITGIVCRAAGKNKIVTNLAQGGRAIPFREVCTQLPLDLTQKINMLSLEVANKIENICPSLADIGLDIMIDQDYKLWFIEANFCDERYSYRESKDYDMWEATHRTPLEFALKKYLAINSKRR